MKYEINKAISIRKIDNEIFIFERDSSTIHTLNGTGATIFEHLESGLDSDNIPVEILNMYDTTIEVVAKDTRDYISELKAKGIIKNAK